MTDPENDFTTWLHRRAATAGYDPDVRGTVSRLAEAAGLDVGSTSRVLRGRSAPSPETLRSLAGPLKVTVIEMFFRAGVLRAEDIAEMVKPDPTVDYSRFTAGPVEPDWTGFGKRRGVPAQSIEQWQKVVQAVTDAFAVSGDRASE